MKKDKIFIISRLLFILCLASVILSGCESTDDAQAQFNGILVEDVTIPVSLTTTYGSEVTLEGSGFEAGDVLILKCGDQRLELPLSNITESGATFEVAYDILSGVIYTLTIQRSEWSQELGYTIFNVTLIANLSIPSTIETEWGEAVTISGTGFEQGDIIEIRYGDAAYSCTTKSAYTSSIIFEMPEITLKGTCYLYIIRDDRQFILGSSKIVNTIPHIDGASIMGIVSLDGVGVADVLISDGDLIVQTDKNGCYYMASEKRNGLVFMILPSGYDVATDASQPQFWHPCTLAADECEQHDFELFSSDNDSYKLIVAADMHLANRNSDYTYFRNGFIAEMKANYNYSSEKVYALNLGDFSWDLYWYANNWSLPNCMNELVDLDFQVWNVMGNHDNDPYQTGDFACESPFRQEVGPIYYSMNLGGVHVIMLDNTIYTNNGGSYGTIGDRAYTRTVSDEQIAWLKKNLAYVDKSTPIIVGMHCPVYTYSWNSSSSSSYVSQSMSSTDNVTELLDCFAGYDQVHIVTGHTHVNRAIQAPYHSNVYEHNIAAVCGTWWWTKKYSSYNICTDGSPAGYKIFDVDGTDLEWQFKGLDTTADKQFTTYDMNSVKSYWQSNSTALSAFSSGNMNTTTRSSDYSDVGSNEVFINIWAYEPDWTIEVKESGKSLAVKQVWKYDPLHTICYDIPRAAAGSSLSFPSTYCMHMFSVTASSSNSTLEIEVTDSFGNVYSESMSRPKNFTQSFD